MRSIILIVLLVAIATVRATEYVYGDAIIGVSTYGIWRAPLVAPGAIFEPEAMTEEVLVANYIGGCMDSVHGLVYMVNELSPSVFQTINFNISSPKPWPSTNSPPISLCTSPNYNSTFFWECDTINMKLITGCWQDKEAVIYSVDPRTGNTTTLGTLPVKLEYDAGTAHLDQEHNILYIPYQNKFYWHSQTTMVTFNLATGQSTEYILQKGQNIMEVTWNPVTQQLIGLNATWFHLGPFPVDGSYHLSLMTPSVWNTTQLGRPYSSGQIVWGASTVNVNGTSYFHCIDVPGSKLPYNRIFWWDLETGQLANGAINWLLQPLSWIEIIEMDD